MKRQQMNAFAETQAEPNDGWRGYETDKCPYPGQMVDIYQDPITRKDFEGRAQLVKRLLPDEGDGLEMWEVRFVDEPDATYSRTLSNRPAPEA